MSKGKAKTIHYDVPEGRGVLAPLLGPRDTHKRLIERRLGVKIAARGHALKVSGQAEQTALAHRVMSQLIERVRDGQTPLMHDIEQLIGMVESAPDASLSAMPSGPVLKRVDRDGVRPKSPNQAKYLDALETQSLVFAVGPAGTGKTYLAMAAAVTALRRKEVERIVLARPAVEAGEHLGFLPGTLVDKVNPYLRPLHDALFDLMGLEQAGRLIESGIIEVAPLAFMRGRTLNNAFVILDEAQNTTREQMKMFLTRLGFSSRAVVTGDVTQVDLPRRSDSGLIHALRILEGIENIARVRLTPIDVVRHPLVQAIVRAYDEAEKGNAS